MRFAGYQIHAAGARSKSWIQETLSSPGVVATAPVKCSTSGKLLLLPALPVNGTKPAVAAEAANVEAFAKKPRRDKLSFIDVFFEKVIVINYDE